MVEIIAALIVAYLIISWWTGRRTRRSQPETNRSVRWHDDSGGRQECVIDAAAVAEQRKSGRCLGPKIIVDWKPGVDTDIDIHGAWLEKHGAANGVHVRRVGNGQPLVRSGRMK